MNPFLRLFHLSTWISTFWTKILKAFKLAPKKFEFHSGVQKCHFGTIKLFWKAHKNVKKIFHSFWHCWVKNSCFVKTSGRFFKISSNCSAALVDGGGALLQERSERNDLELLQFVRLLYSSTQTPSNEILRWAVFMNHNLVLGIG